MKTSVGRMVAALALLGATAGAAIVLAPAPTSAVPAPMATGDTQVSVTIPGPTPSTTGSPTPGGSGGGNGGSGSGGGDGGGGDLPTEDAAPTAPAVEPTPQPDADELQLDPTTIEAGDRLTVTGTGFEPGENVQLVIYSEPVMVGSYPVAADGSFTVEVEETDELRVGRHVLEATGWSSEKVANAGFLVVSSSGSGASLFPWIVWVVVGGVIALAFLGFAIAAATGRLPNPFPMPGRVAE